MFAWLMNLFSKIFGNTAKTNMEKNKDGSSLSEGNWLGPDGIETGPSVPEDWYLTYDGPAPIVEEIYDLNYAVDRGNGAIPIAFYIKQWGVPDGFGKTDYEKNIVDN